MAAMELTLFVIVGAVAVVSAVMMLISENAVHSALFLILNFACIAFFFLMLNAPFLAMVQITVYAGAIMVLFLFVIMLLGAERLIPEKSPRFPWMTPAAVGLALVFLVTTSLAIIRGDINLTRERGNTPHVRAVNVIDGTDAVDIFLDDKDVARNLDYGDHSGFKTWPEGQYHLTVFPAGADRGSETPLVEQDIELNAGELLTLTAIGTQGTPQLVVANENMGSTEDQHALRVMAVNALPDQTPIDIVDTTDPDNRDVLVSNLEYGQSSASTEIEEGVYDFSIYSSGDQRGRLLTLRNREVQPDTSILWVFAAQHRPDNSWAQVTLTLKTDTQASFGSPSFVGQLLFSRYVLPFEMVSLLLLAAMIGTLVLTHDMGKAQKRQVVRRLANPTPVDLPVIDE